MVTPSRAVGVEVFRFHTMLLQVFAGRGIGLEGTGRRDVVGGDRIPEQSQDVGILDVINGLGLLAHALEERRMLDVGGLVAPLVHLADRKSTRLNSSHVRISYAVFC